MVGTRVVDTLSMIRRLLLYALMAGMLGTGLELLLLEHTEEWTQLVPLVLLGVGTLAGATLAALPSRAVLQLFRGLMGLFLVAGVLGLVLHYRGNVEFELEMRPSMAGLELVWNALTGATPALAPGSMLLLGVIGGLYTYRHPLTRRSATKSSDSGRGEATGPAEGAIER